MQAKQRREVLKALNERPTSKSSIASAQRRLGYDTASLRMNLALAKENKVINKRELLPPQIPTKATSTTKQSTNLKKVLFSDDVTCTLSNNSTEILQLKNDPETAGHPEKAKKIRRNTGYLADALVILEDDQETELDVPDELICTTMDSMETPSDPETCVAPLKERSADFETKPKTVTRPPPTPRVSTISAVCNPFEPVTSSTLQTQCDSPRSPNLQRDNIALRFQVEELQRILSEIHQKSEMQKQSATSEFDSLVSNLQYQYAPNDASQSSESSIESSHSEEEEGANYWKCIAVTLGKRSQEFESRIGDLERELVDYKLQLAELVHACEAMRHIGSKLPDMRQYELPSSRPPSYCSVDDTTFTPEVTKSQTISEQPSWFSFGFFKA
jgi:regulator of replication initiation timing